MAGISLTVAARPGPRASAFLRSDLGGRPRGLRHGRMSMCGLATDDDGLRALSAEHGNDKPGEYDMDLQTYAELLLAAHVAWRRRRVLWVVG